MLIKNCRLFESAANNHQHFDVLIEQGKVKEIAPHGLIPDSSSPEHFDAKGLMLMPGLVDLHVHLREPGFEWKGQIKDGCEAAILGGYTSICCMPNTKPVNDRAEITRFIIEKASSLGLAKVFPIGSVSIGLEGKALSPMSELRKAGCVAFSDDGEPIYNAGVMRRALEWCLMLDAVISCHEEDKCLTAGGCMNESALSLKLGLKGMPSVGEDVMVARDIELARYTGGKVHVCHVSTARSVELIRRAKNDGIRVTCEVTPHHLVLTEDAVIDYDSSYKMSPPLRTEEDRQALIEGLRDGTIDAIASDHAPHEFDSKCCEFDRASFGILGLQTSLPLILDFVNEGVISPVRAQAVLAGEPAKIFGLEAGTIKPGSAADLILIDPKAEWTFDSNSAVTKSLNSPFLGRKMSGQVRHVFVNGKVVLKDGELNAN